MILWLFSFLAAIGAAQPPRPTAAEKTAVIDLIYNIELSSAAAAASALGAAHPGHPVGPFYSALVSYELFLLEEPRSTTTLAAFDRNMGEAARRAQAWIATEPAQGYYYLGAAQGFNARVLVSQKRFFRALGEGTRGIKSLRQALALDPGLEDAYLALGMYHYFRSRVPAAAKPFAFLFFGEFADREVGLSELRRAADKGIVARTEAESILAAIYCSDEEALWEKAAALFSELMTRHPNNPFYRLRAAYTAERRGLFDEAAALADPDGAWVARLAPDVRSAVRRAAFYRFAEAQILGGRPEKAEAALHELEDMQLSEPDVDWVLLRRAMAIDARGNRVGADHLYRAVESGEAAKAAKLYLKLRYPKGPKTVKPLTGVEFPD